MFGRLWAYGWNDQLLTYHSSLAAEGPEHAQTPSPITDDKIGKVFHGHGDVA